MQYWIAVNSQRKGPMTLSELKAMNPSSADLVWREGLENWVQAGTLPELSDIFPAPQEDAVPEIDVPELQNEQPVSDDANGVQQSRPVGESQPAEECRPVEENISVQPEPAATAVPECNCPDNNNNNNNNNESWREGYAAGFAAGHQQRTSCAAAQPAGATKDDCPPTYFALSITMLIVMFFCCCCSNPISLIGIVAIIYSNEVRPAYEQGNIEDARRFSNYALYWNIANVALSIAGVILTLIWSALTGIATNISYYI